MNEFPEYGDFPSLEELVANLPIQMNRDEDGFILFAVGDLDKRIIPTSEYLDKMRDYIRGALIHFGIKAKAVITGPEVSFVKSRDVFFWSIGSLEHKLFPIAEVFKKFESMIANVTPKHFVHGPELRVVPRDTFDNDVYIYIGSEEHHLAASPQIIECVKEMLHKVCPDLKYKIWYFGVDKE